MKRSILATLSACAFALTACVANEPPAGDPGSPGAPGASCTSGAAGSGVGQPYTDALAERLRAASGAREVRRLTPDTMTTMEFQGDRLNIVVDANDVVREVRCG